MALTDHDTTRGWAEAMAAAEHHSVRLIRGIELSTRYVNFGQHLLGFFNHERPDEALADLNADGCRRTSLRCQNELVPTG